MEVLSTDLKKFLGKTITILMNDGSHKRIKVVGVQELSGQQKIVGHDDEGQNVLIKASDMAMIYPINGVM